MFFNVTKTFIAFSCKMCGKYSKKESEIRKHLIEKHIDLVNVSIDFKNKDIGQKRPNQN